MIARLHFRISSAIIMPIKFLRHTADIKMRVTARDLPELFGEAVKGMLGIMSRRFGRDPDFTSGNYEYRQINIKSSDLTSLLIDFLSEVLAQSDINDEIYETVKFKKLTETEADAELVGRPVKSKALEIKAVTYHQSEVKRTKRGYEATIIFDI